MSPAQLKMRIGLIFSRYIYQSSSRELKLSKKRDAAYYEGRLRRDYPKEFADFKAGRYSSVRAAAGAAGLIHLPTRLDALKREWKCAGVRERDDFRRWIAAAIPAAVLIRGPAKRSIIDSAGHLKPVVVKFIVDWTTVNRRKPGNIMREMGFSNFDYTLAHALRRGAPLRSEVILPLEAWLVGKGF